MMEAKASTASNDEDVTAIMYHSGGRGGTNKSTNVRHT